MMTMQGHNPKAVVLPYSRSKGVFIIRRLFSLLWIRVIFSATFSTVFLALLVTKPPSSFSHTPLPSSPPLQDLPIPSPTEDNKPVSLISASSVYHAHSHRLHTEGFSPLVVLAGLAAGDRLILVLQQIPGTALNHIGNKTTELPGGDPEHQPETTEAAIALLERSTCVYWTETWTEALPVLSSSVSAQGQLQVHCPFIHPMHSNQGNAPRRQASVSVLLAAAGQRDAPAAESNPEGVRIRLLSPPPHQCCSLSPFLPSCLHSKSAPSSARPPSSTVQDWRDDSECLRPYSHRLTDNEPSPVNSSPRERVAVTSSAPAALLPSCSAVPVPSTVKERERYLRRRIKLVVDLVHHHKGLYLFVRNIRNGMPERAKRILKQITSKGQGSIDSSNTTRGPPTGPTGFPSSIARLESQRQGAEASRRRRLGSGLGEYQGVINVTCVYGGCGSALALAGTMEVVLCPLPPPGCFQETAEVDRKGDAGGQEAARARIPVTVRDVQGITFPSLAFSDGRPTFPVTVGVGSGPKNGVPSQDSKPYFLCSCTMVWNMGKFLREWLVYHHWMGVERFFLYDNNSDDNTTSVAADFNSWVRHNPGFMPRGSDAHPAAAEILGESEGVGKVPEDQDEVGRVTVHAWPWLKSQQAGFSHCLLRAAPLCQWVLFSDVDEFIRPRFIEELHTKEEADNFVSDKGPMLRHLMRQVAGRVQGAVRKGQGNLHLGQICFQCVEFGPSGLMEHPKRGVSAAYTCRKTRPQRHKCMVRPEAVADALHTRIHEFDVRAGYLSNIDLSRGKESLGWFNHYRFQVWEDFRSKFLRRAASQVKDWSYVDGTQTKEKQLHRDFDVSLRSLDPEHMPADWPMRYCEVNDSLVQGLVEWMFVEQNHVEGERKFLWE